MSRLMRYRFWQPGNPQNRVFFTDFFVSLIRPRSEVTPNTVCFKCPVEMTKFDIKNYLQNIYNVPVAKVNTHIHFAKIWRDHKNRRIKPEPDYKIAHVTLGEGMTFEFPELFPDAMEKEKEVVEELKTKQKTEDSKRAHQGGVPGWFSL
ncbi:large ribosomal subunit protein uL23m-like isoform X2 [Glandiceps talaboti]